MGYVYAGYGATAVALALYTARLLARTRRVARTLEPSQRS